MKKWKKTIYIVLSVLLWIGLWTYFAYRLNKPVLLPYPGAVFRTFFKLLTGKEFLPILWGSFTHIAKGFLCALVLGTVLAVAASTGEPIAILLMPGVKLVKTVPVASFIILLLFFVEPAEIGFVISLLMVFPVVYENVYKGISSADRKLIEAAEVFRVGWWKRLTRLYIPASVPYALAACSAGLGLCWKAGVAAELIAQAPKSIGRELYYAKLYVDAEGVFAWTILIVLVSVLFEKLFLTLFRLLTVAFSAPTLWYSPKKLLCYVLGIRSRAGRLEEAEAVREETEIGSLAQESLERREICTLSGVSKGFEGNDVLKEVNLSLCTGEVFLITGPSGAGKTTLLRLLMGLEKPDGGTVTIADSVRIAAVFQENRVCEQLSALQNVRLTARPCTKAMAASLLTFSGIEPAPGKAVGTYSGGMQRRVAWCRALAAESELVILDEPFTGLDEEKKLRMLRLLYERKRSNAIVIVTHNASEMERIRETFENVRMYTLSDQTLYEKD